LDEVQKFEKGGGPSRAKGEGIEEESEGEPKAYLTLDFDLLFLRTVSPEKKGRDASQ